MRKTIFVLAFALLGAGVAGASACEATIFGPAVVVDADTVDVGGVRVRLKGVDAAELGTPRGDEARRQMQAIVTGTLSCTLTGEKTHGREVGFCVTPAGLDINREIIRNGHALSCPRFDDRYLSDETAETRAAQRRASYCRRR